MSKGQVMQVLHVVGSPRGVRSRTLTVSHALLERLRSRVPDVEIVTRDLFARDLPPVDGNNMDSKYRLLAGEPVDPMHAESWSHIEDLIREFLAADVYVLAVPMWNFSIPYALKHYIDAIVQPGYLFAYNAAGVPVPLVHDKMMICVTTRGGDYSPVSTMHAYDAQESYLRQIFGFVGITQIQFVHAQPVDLGPALRTQAVDQAKQEAISIADQLSGSARQQVGVH